MKVEAEVGVMLPQAHQKLDGVRKEPPLHVSKAAWACCHCDFRFWEAGIVRDYISVVFEPPAL